MENGSTILILGIIILCAISVLLFVWLKLKSQNQEGVSQFMTESHPVFTPMLKNETFESVDEKLKKLKDLLASDLISEQDYERMKAEILEGTFRPNSPSLSGPIPDGLSDNAMAKVISFLKANQKINAIKLYREETNLGLKEAKDAVEEIERRMK